MSNALYLRLGDVSGQYDSDFVTTKLKCLLNELKYSI
jgi:hypothetical protein